MIKYKYAPMICIFMMMGKGLVSTDAPRHAYLMSDGFLCTTCRENILRR